MDIILVENVMDYNFINLKMKKILLKFYKKMKKTKIIIIKIEFIIIIIIIDGEILMEILCLNILIDIILM